MLTSHCYVQNRHPQNDRTASTKKPLTDAGLEKKKELPGESALEIGHVLVCLGVEGHLALHKVPQCFQVIVLQPYPIREKEKERERVRIVSPTAGGLLSRLVSY